MKRYRQLKNLSLAVPLLFFISCNHQPQEAASVQPEQTQAEPIVIKKEPVKGSGDMEEKVMAAVMELPESQQAQNYIDSISNHKKGLGGIIDGPEPGKPEYAVRVGFNGDERFETYYFFYVDTITFKVKIQDVAMDTILPIEEWRKLRQSN